MKFEIVDAYLIRLGSQDKPKGWSLHVYFPEMEMDIRGIQLLKFNTGWFLRMPFLRNYDPDQNKVVTFPLMAFIDSEKTRVLIDEIKSEAIRIVEKKLIEITEEEIAKARKLTKPKKQKNEKKNEII